MSLVRHFAVEESIERGRQLSWSVPDELSKLIEIEQAQEILHREARCQARMINWSLQLARAENNEYCSNTKEDFTGTNEISKQVAAPSVTFHSRLRSALLANLTRSIVELYQLCDEEEDILVCSDAISLFARGGRDFNVLSDRLNERRRAGIDQNSVRNIAALKSFSEQGAQCNGLRSKLHSSNSYELETKSAELLERTYSPDGRKGDTAGNCSQQASMLRGRNVDVAYASYIKKDIEITVEERNLLEASATTEKKTRVVTYENGEDTKGGNHQYFDQRIAAQTNSRNSTLRAAAAPFQPALVARGRGLGPVDLLCTDSNSDQVAVVKDLSVANFSPKRTPGSTPTVSAISNDSNQDSPSKPDTDVGAKSYRKLSSNPSNSLTTASKLKQQLQSRQPELVREGGAPSPNSSNKDTSAKGKMAFATVSTLAQADMRQKKEAASANSSDTYSSYVDPFSLQEQRRNCDRGREEREAAMEAEVSEASEHVWRQVEKWIEAEAMAEEAAWDVLAIGHDNDNEDNVNDTEDEERYVGDESDCAEEEFSGRSADLDSDSASRSLPLNPTPQAHTSLAIVRSHHSLNSMGDENNVEEPASPSLLDSVSHVLLSSSLSPFSAVSNIPSTATTVSSSPTLASPDLRSESPAQLTINRFLHAKLSSPDRRRAISPVEAKKRQEAKQHSAESNRDKTVAERRQKALLVSDRVKTRSINEQKRLNLAELALEERLRDAEKRHEECIKVIKLRAGNENTKVSEVMFINNMNAEGIVDQLRQKLVEVEARVLAAAMRRQDILSGISARQRKRNNKKVQQMSELRLQLERQKMERWDKLQRRLEAVQFRRQARFKEMQRRSDAQELTRARLASSNFLKDASGVENISGVKSATASLDSLASTMNLLKAQLTAPFIEGCAAAGIDKKETDKEREKAPSVSVASVPIPSSTSSKCRQASTSIAVGVSVGVSKSEGLKTVAPPVPTKAVDSLSTSSKGRKPSPSLPLPAPQISKIAKAAGSTIRPFVTSLKSPSVTGAGGFFDNSPIPMKISTKGVAGNSKGNNNEGSRGSTSGAPSPLLCSPSLHLDSQQQPRPMESMELGESDSDKMERPAYPDSVPMELKEDSPVALFSRAISRSGSVVESGMEDSSSSVLEGSTACAKKKKRRIKKKDKVSEADEEMLLLDALLTAQQQLQDLDKESLVSSASITSRDCHDVVIVLHPGMAAKWPGIENSAPRPRLNKQLNLFLKALRRKKAATALRDIAIERGHLVYSIYLASVKVKELPSPEGHETFAEGSVHGLMKYICERSQALHADGVLCLNEMPRKETAITMAKDVLSRMESAIGDDRKETGLFLKQGGGFLLRILIGDELGLLSNRQDSPLGSIDEAAGNGLLMLVCRALTACTSTPGARETVLSLGLAYYIADLVIVISGHLRDWLASHWSTGQGQGQGQGLEHGLHAQVMWPEESQALPLLLSALTKLLKHVTVLFSQCSSSKSKKPSTLRQSESWLRYLFVSGTVPSLCRAIRSLQTHHRSVREEALPHLLLYSLVDCVGSLSSCITAVDCSNATSSTPAMREQVCVEVVLLSPLESPVTGVVNSIGTLSASTRKEMVSMLRDLQLVPSLAVSLHSLLKPIGAANSIARPTSIGASDTPIMRTASVFSITGLIVEALRALAVTDISLLQCQLSSISLPETHPSNHTANSAVTLSSTLAVTTSLRVEDDDPWRPSRDVSPQVASLLGASCGLLINSLMALLETKAELLKEGAASATSTAFSAGPSLLSTCSKGVSHSRDLMIHFRARDADCSVQHLLALINACCKLCPALSKNLTGEDGSDTGLLASLFHMPDRYFTDERFRAQLIPALESLHIGKEQELEDRIRGIIEPTQFAVSS